MRTKTSWLRGSARLSLIAVAAIPLLLPQAARAQTLFEWFAGSNSTKNSVADRQVVGFDTAYAPGEIVVSFGDRRLYHVTQRGRAVSYPIGVPRAESRWQGTLRVSQKRVDPPWTPTAQMRRESPSLPVTVAGGDPKNPLGVRALYLGSTLYRIHGTDAPSTIGQNVSRGCVRMHNAHVVELYERVPVGAKVMATWKRFNTPPLHNERIGQSDWRPW